MKKPWFSVVDVVELHGRSMADIAREICNVRGVSLEDLRGRSQRLAIVAVRREFARRVAKERPDIQGNMVANFLNRDPTTGRRYLDRCRLDRRTSEVLRNLERQGMTVFIKWGMPQWALEIVRNVAFSHKVYVSELASAVRRQNVVIARNEAMYLVKAAKPSLSSPTIARWFNRDHTSVLHGIASYQEKSGAPALFHYSLNRDRKLSAANARLEKQRLKEAA